MRHRRAGRARAAVLSLVIVCCACGGSLPAATPSSTPSPSPVPSATLSPTLGPTVSATPSSAWLSLSDQSTFQDGSMTLVVWNGSRFIGADASGTNGPEPSGLPRTWWSTDGSTWTSGSIQAGQITALAAAPQGLVLAGTDTGVWASADGTVWHQVLREATVAALVTGPSAMLAFVTPEDADSNPLPTRTWISSDGSHWRRIDPPALRGFEVAGAVAAPGGGYVAFGENVDTLAPGLWWSAHGLAWQGDTLDWTDPDSLDALVGGPRGLLLVGRSGDGSWRVWASADGRAWSPEAQIPDQFDTLIPLAVTASGYLAINPVETPADPSDPSATDSPTRLNLIESSDGVNWATGDAIELSDVAPPAVVSCSYAAGPATAVIACDTQREGPLVFVRPGL